MLETGKEEVLGTAVVLVSKAHSILWMLDREMMNRVEEKEKAVNTKVLFVCREVYETEAAYVKDLQTIITIFKHPVSPRVRTPGRHP